MGWFKRLLGTDESRTPPTKSPTGGAPSPAATAVEQPGIQPDVLPDYWLQVCDAFDAITALVRTTGSNDIIDTLFRYPILMLPGFPPAIIAGGRLGAGLDQRGLNDSDTRESYTAIASRLTGIQDLLRQAPPSYARLSDHLGRTLARDKGGSLRINLRYALDRFRAAATLFGEAPEAAGCWNFTGVACELLTDMEVDARSHLELAVQSYGRARAMAGQGEKRDEYAQAEAKARQTLVELGEDAPIVDGMTTSPSYWLRVARRLGAMDAYAEAVGRGEGHEVIRSHPIMMLPELPLALDFEAGRQRSAADAAKLRQTSLDLAQMQLGREDSESYAFIMIFCANQLVQSEFGDLRTNYERALALFTDARKLEPTGPAAHRLVISEAIDHRLLAELGVDPPVHLTQGLQLAREAVALYREGADHDLALRVEQRILSHLVALDIEPAPA